MEIMRLKYVFLLIIFCTAAGLAEDDTMSGIFHPSFHTLQVGVYGNDYAPPVITLNSDDCIKISFDEISDDRRYMRYSLVHCDKDWRPSDLVEPEYLEGFNLGDVELYDYSRMTATHYVHYEITLPNDQVRFTVSGNYLLKVFSEDDPDELLLQARFMVTENTMKISGDVTSRTDIDYNARHQQLSVRVDTDNVNVHDMYSDISVCISQNGRTDNSVCLSRPMRVSGRVIYFEHQQSLIFPAGNEFRRMETVSISYPGMNIYDIEYANPYYHMSIYPDKPRYAGNYVYDNTQYGQFTIREYNSEQSDIEADYIVTHFSLEMPELINTDVFLDGEFTCHRYDPNSRMIYNSETGAYEKSLLLKQGAYNYQYLAVPYGSMRGKTSIVEGDFYQTVNEYLVTVYHRPPGSRYDRLVGVTVLYSGK